MVSNTGAEVSSKALIELQSNLIALSNDLNELYNALHGSKTKLSEEWLDEKYNEFAEEFEQTEKVISELSEKYVEWANKYLPSRIEAVKEIETACGTLGYSPGLLDTSVSYIGVSSNEVRSISLSEKELNKRGIDRIEGESVALNMTAEATKFSRTLFGMSHKIKADGSAHTTYYDGGLNSRVSYDTNKKGEVLNLHRTDQNKSKKDAKRHK